MQYSMSGLKEKYGVSYNTIFNIVCRSEFERYRSGGNGGVYLELNPESEALIEKNLYRKRRGGRYDITSGAGV